MGIKASTITAIRALPLSDVLSSEGVELKRVGREAVTLCPWHGDTNPSLTINDDKGLCFCFACGGGSDAIDFIQQKFNLSFQDAIERIASKHSIAVERDDLDPQEALRIAEERRRQFKQLNEQQELFRGQIRSDSGIQARQWLISRKIEPETSREFGLGFCTSGYFHNRVTVPIHDHRGNLVGFTGRKIVPATDGPKYKNSASSDVFDKGSLLFNEHRIADACRLSQKIIFVEGHFDVISMWQNGIHNAVATQGTAGPTLESIRRLSRHCANFVLCYDADDGGLKATENFLKTTSDLSLNGEINILIAKIPNGLDPDEALRSGVNLSSIIENAQQWIDWRIDQLTAGLDYSDTRAFSLAETQIKSIVSKIKSPALRQYYVDKAAKVLCESSSTAAKFAKEWFESIPKSRVSESWARPSTEWTKLQAERRILRSYIHFPETRERLGELMSRLDSGPHVWLWSRIVELQNLGATVSVDVLKIILAVAEPDYVKPVRPLLMPTIKLQSSDGILDHAERILTR